MATTVVRDKVITGHLKRIIGNPVGQFIPLYDDDVTIGRSKKSGVCIHDPNVSRNHCTLRYSKEGWSITDLGGVNGTYLDNVKLAAHSPEPLKDGLGIYLGPPAEAPYAFVFIKAKAEPEIHITEPEAQKTEPGISQSKSESGTTTPIQLQSDQQPTLKRRAKSASQATASKKPTLSSTCSRPPASSQATTDSEYSEDGNDSDTSINSLDSLKTRIRKINSTKKKKKKRSRDDVNTPSTSASPALILASYDTHSHESAPSTSAAHETNQPTTSSEVSQKVIKSLKSGPSNMFKELDTLFTDGSDSLPDVLEDSESLLDEADHEDTSRLNKVELKNKLAKLNEQLKIAHCKLLQENAEQKQKLNQLMEESTDNSESSKKLSTMIEEELICNICTEVFIKATTLGCSHTYCEHCITEWKKKQKRCPMCREPISSETRILIMDNFIDKVVEKLDKEYQDKRKQVIAERDAKSKEKVKKSKRKKKSSNPRSEYRPNPAVREHLVRQLMGLSRAHVVNIATIPTCITCGRRDHLRGICPNR